MVAAFICLALSPAVSAETVNVGLYESNTQLYGDDNLNLAVTFDKSAIPSGYNRTTAQEELGETLYNSIPEIHDEIIQKYHEKYPEMSHPTGGITYVYNYGDRLEVTIYEDGSLGILRNLVSPAPVMNRAAGQTAVFTVEYVDSDWFFPAHTTARMSAWFDYDQQNAPTCHLVELLAISHNGDRTSTTTSNVIPDQVNGQTTLTGIVTTQKVSGDLDRIQYTLKIYCTKYGDLSSDKSKREL